MKRLLALLGVALFATAARAEVHKLGKPLEGLPAVSLEQVLAKPEAGQMVRLEGSIEATGVEIHDAK